MLASGWETGYRCLSLKTNYERRMNYQSKLIEYIDTKKFHCAFVLEDAGKRLRVLNQNGREVLLPQSRVVHASTGAYRLDRPREELLGHLRKTTEERRSLMERVDLPEVWELAVEDRDGAFSPTFLAELCFGEESGDNQVAALLRCVFDDSIYFKYKEGLIIAHPPGLVEQKRETLARAREQDIFLSEGAKNLIELWQGRDPGDWPGRAESLELIAGYYLRGNEAPEAAVARELLQKAQLTRPHDPFHLLVKAGVWTKDENVPLLRHEIPVEFSPAITAAARETAAKSEENKPAGSRNLEHLDVLTIDGEETRDYDDGLHIECQGENFLVGIHISDVAAFVKPGDPLFEEAARRATSIYFPDRKVPMLPPEISEGACSLIRGESRAAISFLVRLSSEAVVLDFEIVPSTIRVKRQLTYPEVDRLLAADDDLRRLADLAVKLRLHRLAADAVLLPIPDLNIIIKEEGEVAIEQLPVDTPSRTLVSELMILANTLGAQYLADREAPALFRCQEPPKKRLLYGYEPDIFLNFRQRKFLSPMELSLVPKPHSGIGSQQYTTLTSPIRRLLDLIIQHQLKSCLAGERPVFNESNLRDFAGRMTETLARVGLVRQLRQRYWLLKYLARRPGQRLEALVLERNNNNRYQVLLLDLLLIADLTAGGLRAEPGEVIAVRVEKASPLDNTLKLTT